MDDSGTKVDRYQKNMAYWTKKIPQSKYGTYLYAKKHPPYMGKCQIEISAVSFLEMGVVRILNDGSIHHISDMPPGLWSKEKIDLHDLTEEMFDLIVKDFGVKIPGAITE